MLVWLYGLRGLAFGGFALLGDPRKGWTLGIVRVLGFVSAGDLFIWAGCGTLKLVVRATEP